MSLAEIMPAGRSWSGWTAIRCEMPCSAIRFAASSSEAFDLMVTRPWLATVPGREGIELVWETRQGEAGDEAPRAGLADLGDDDGVDVVADHHPSDVGELGLRAAADDPDPHHV